MDMLQRLFYTALSAASLFIFIVKVSLSHWKSRGILHEKPKFLVGNLGGVGRKRHIRIILQQLYIKYHGRAPFIGCYAFLKPMVLLLDLDLIEHVLIKDASYFTDRGLYSNPEDEPLSENLLQVNGDEWQVLRGMSEPCFTTERIGQMLPAVLKICETLEQSLDLQLRAHERLAVNSLVERYNIDVTSKLAFGLEGESLIYSTTKFREMARGTLNNFNWITAYFSLHFPNLARLMRYKSYKPNATEYFLQLVQDKLYERELSRSTKQADFLQMFADLRKSDNPEERLSDKQVAAQLFSFIVVGLRTCNAAMTFCLYELALQPDLQEEVRKEVQEVMGKKKGSFNMPRLEAIGKLQLLKQVLYETLRKYPPYVFLLRNTNAEYEVPDSVFMLQKNNHLVVPVEAIHHDPDIYPDPKKFDPARFSPAVMQQRHPMSFLPFGAGPRNCIAQELAELQMLLGLATLLRSYSFSPCGETIIPMVYDNAQTVLMPKSDIMLKIQHV